MVKMVVGVEYHFNASHALEILKEPLHGHTYEVRVEVRGELGKGNMVVDFLILDKIIKPLIEKLDHSHLNNLLKCPNPTAEYIAKWLADEISKGLKERNLPVELHSIYVREGKEGWAKIEF